MTSISSKAARLSIAAAMTYQLLLIALIFIRPDLDPSWHTISEWAIGRHGWIMSLAFLISAVSYAALFVAIKSEVPSGWGKIGLGLLFVCFIVTVGVGLFTTDPYPPEKHLTPRGIVHIISGTSAMALLPIAALLINLSLARKNKSWSGARWPLLITAGLPILAFIGFVVHLSFFCNANGRLLWALAPDWLSPANRVSYVSDLANHLSMASG
ncbi:MAG TPA: DUF998 domain-containing protein [Pyrinomonadaceae bacterium]|nr:DUF998 domain-containing protein [Pyrinomonadaceae bacterium]